MSDLLDIQEKLGDTGEMIVRTERLLATNPGDKSVVFNLQSLHKRRQQLEAEFAMASAETGTDLCRYRFLLDGENAKIAGLASNLSNYQSLVSILYDAVKSGPRQTSKISAETQALTAFGFGYTFIRSVGFVLTVPNSRLKGLDTDLDQAFGIISELVKIGKPEEIRTYARRVGRAPIRILYRWANDHLKSKLSAEIEWSRGDCLHAKFLVQMPEFRAITAAIDQTSDQEQTTLTEMGTLQGADAENRTFHFVTESGQSIRGELTQTVDPDHPVLVPGRYKAEIVRTRIIFYSTEEERDQFQLTSLERL